MLLGFNYYNILCTFHFHLSAPYYLYGIFASRIKHQDTHYHESVQTLLRFFHKINGV